MTGLLAVSKHSAWELLNLCARRRLSCQGWRTQSPAKPETAETSARTRSKAVSRMGWRAWGKALHQGKTRLEKKAPSLLTSSHSPSGLIASTGHHSLAHKPGPNTLHIQLCPVPSPPPCPGLAQLQPSTAGTALCFLQGFTAGFNFCCSKAVHVRGRWKRLLRVEHIGCTTRVTCFVWGQGKMTFLIHVLTTDILCLPTPPVFG